MYRHVEAGQQRPKSEVTAEHIVDKLAKRRIELTPEQVRRLPAPELLTPPSPPPPLPPPPPPPPLQPHMITRRPFVIASQVELQEPITEIGDHVVHVQLERGHEASLVVTVEPR
jgi:hypothetical protein